MGGGGGRSGGEGVSSLRIVVVAATVSRHGTARTALHYEAFGRLMTALFDSGSPGIMEGAKRFYFWETMHDGFSLSWERGPHAGEVVQELVDLAADNEVTHALRPGDVVWLHKGDTDPGGYTSADVCGVRFLLRPTDTIGHEWACPETRAERSR